MGNLRQNVLKVCVLAWAVSSHPISRWSDGERALSEADETKNANENDHTCPHGLDGMKKLPSIVEHIRGPRPSEYTVIMPLTALGAVATGAILLPSFLMLGTSPGHLRKRSLQIRIVLVAPFFIAFLKLIAVLAPRFWHLAFVLIALYEVIAFWSLFHLIFGFIADSDENALVVLSKAPEQRIWIAPPCCCIAIFASFMTPRVPSKNDFILLNVLLWQFTLVVPTASVLDIVVREQQKRILSALELCSLLCAVYALFVVMKMVETTLADKRIHAKFWTLKGAIMAHMIPYRIAAQHAPRAIRLEDFCFSGEALAAAWASAVAALIAVPLAGLGRYAFPKEDLEEQSPSDTEVEMAFVPKGKTSAS